MFRIWRKLASQNENLRRENKFGVKNNLQAGTTEKRTDGVDADIIWSILGGQTLGCIVHGRLAGIVPDETWARPRGASGGNVNY